MAQPRPDDPLTKIEDNKAQKDLGAMAVNVLTGALEESREFYLAFFATAAYFTGVMKSGDVAQEDDNDNGKDT